MLMLGGAKLPGPGFEIKRDEAVRCVTPVNWIRNDPGSSKDAGGVPKVILGDALQRVRIR
jgi:hypothetical protein